MTVESYAQAPAYTIAGVGPYPIPHPYLAGTIVAYVLIEDVPTQLDGADFSVDPVTAVDQGNLLLTDAAATTHGGRTLWIERATPLEQGWMARDDGREAGMEAQLDQDVMGAQEDRAQINAALRARKPMAAFDPMPGHVPVVRADGNGWENGPTVDEVQSAQDYALAADKSANDAEQYATAAAQYTDATHDDFAALTAETKLFTVGRLLRTRDLGHAYEVVPVGSTNQHLTTVAGNGLRALPDSDGLVSVAALGIKPDGATNWENEPIWEKVREIAVNGGIKFPPGYYAQSFNMGADWSDARMHMEPGAVFGGVLHLISSAIPAKHTVSSITRAANVVTVATATAHGFAVGDKVQVRYVATSGAGSVDFNGWDHVVTEVVDTTTFRFAQTGPDASGTLVGASLVAEAPLRGVRVTGTWTTTDRLGSINCHDCEIERAHVLSDPYRHFAQPGTSCRGAHIYVGTNDLRIGDLVIDDCVQPNSDAALAVDGNSWNPSNLKIGRVWIKDSECHGAYLTGHGHDIGELRVDGFARGAYAGTLQDSDGATQSGYVKAFWSNRCWDSRIELLRTSQNPAGSRGYENHHALVDETGSTFYGTANRGLHIETWLASNVRRGGIRIGDVYSNGDSHRVNAKIGTLEVALAPEGLTAGEYGIRMYGGDAEHRTTIDLLRLVDFGANKAIYAEYQAKAAIGRIEAINLNAPVLYQRGRLDIGEIAVRWTGGSPTSPLVEFANPAIEGSRIGVLDLVSPAIITAQAFKVSSAAGTRWSVGLIRTRNMRHSNGLIELNAQLGCKIEAFDCIGPDNTGTFLRFIGSATDMYFGPGRVTGFAQGIDKNGATLARVTTVGLGVNGNTTPTNVPAGEIDAFGGAGVTL